MAVGAVVGTVVLYLARLMVAREPLEPVPSSNARDSGGARETAGT